jgi:hypothetical protein
MAFAPKDDACTMADSIQDMIFDFFDRVLVNQRALQNAGVKPVPDFQLLDRSNEFRGKGVINAVLDIDPVCTDARLAGVPEFGDNCAFDSRIEIGIVKDDERSVAT